MHEGRQGVTRKGYGKNAKKKEAARPYLFLPSPEMCAARRPHRFVGVDIGSKCIAQFDISS